MEPQTTSIRERLPGSDQPAAVRPGNVITVDIERLRTGLGCLRRGGRPRPARHPELAEMPVRVVPAADGTLEVVDGFKRLERLRGQGAEQVAVVVEQELDAVEKKAALLAANNPPRTLSAMDEARVVYALRHRDELGPMTIAAVCGKKPGWVKTRLLLAERLAEPVAERVDAGTVGVGLARALCALKPDEQETVCKAVEQHRLRGHEALALVSAYRAADNDRQRSQLVSEPLEVVRPRQRSASPLGALGAHLEEKLDGVSKALDELAGFQLPDEGLTPAERRRLEAKHRAVSDQLFSIAQALGCEQLSLAKQEVDDGAAQPTRRASGHPPHDRTAEPRTSREAAAAPADQARAVDRAAARADRRAAPPADRHAPDRADGWGQPQGGPRPARAAGLSEPAEKARGGREGRAGKQARSVPPTHPPQGGQGADGLAHPARDTRRGLQRLSEHPGRLRAHPAQPDGAEQEGLASVRDTPG
jgi:ParB-like chromosome segregation protein Spo0J